MTGGAVRGLRRLGEAPTPEPDPPGDAAHAGPREPRPDLARRLVRDSRRVGFQANATGALVIFLLTAVVGPGGDDIPSGRRVELVVVFVTFVALTFGVASVGLTRASRPIREALEAGRPLVGRNRRRLFAGPWLNALVSFSAWGTAAVFFGAYTALRLGSDASGATRLALGILLGGLTTMAVIYLLNDRALQPLYALAFRDQPPKSVQGVAVRPRLLLSWVLGAAIPMLGVLTLIFEPDASVGELQRITVVMVLIALVAGSLITLRAARSVADPLESVRAAMARVGDGHFDAAVAVDDATEIGILQAGFNEMVSGLRDRERMRDLFGRHVGDDVARQALQQGVELGGEVREASALFVDLVGSTALAAARPPGEVVDVLNDFFGAVVRVTEAHGGMVNKFEGDAALCVFGAPVAHDDHAARGLQAARALREELARLQATHPQLDAGIGISSGEVLAGNVGAEERYEYTVIGDPVNEAARLTDEAKRFSGRVLASEATVVAAAAGAAGRWEPVGERMLRGRSEPTRLYEPAD